MENLITILVNNKAKPGLKEEHGLALLLNYDNLKILFDTGQHDALFFNAKQLEIKLDDLDTLILSHGHYDHGSNVSNILELNPNLKFFAHQECLKSRYSCNNRKKPKYAGLAEVDKLAITKLNSSRCCWCKQFKRISKGIWVTSQIPRNNDFEDSGGCFSDDHEGQIPDLLTDDLTLCLETEEGLTVVTGCCHAGIVNTLEYISKVSDQKIIRIIGGLHLKNASAERMEKTIDYLNRLKLKEVIPLHCTGEEKTNELQKRLFVKVVNGYGGLTIKI